MSMWEKQQDLWKYKNSQDFYMNYESGKKRSMWLASRLKEFEFESIFEVGCNSGRNLKYIKQILNKDVGGLDINPDAINMARQNVEGKFYVSSAVDINVGEKWDVVFTMGVMIHIPPDGIEKVVENCLNLANKYVIHIEGCGPDKIINGPKEMLPQKSIKARFRWEPNLYKPYSERGYIVKTEKLDMSLRGSDLKHILIIKK